VGYFTLRRVSFFGEMSCGRGIRREAESEGIRKQSPGPDMILFALLKTKNLALHSLL
jgi:hypothetical protein